ncbi:MAG: 23S rRNA (uracil(1939)-C(5))-methyltransferase RlmD [Ignavibacteria bacterium]|nr:23S rRNA (uracil(1939)-C(5))-methyltransferase RlmD [Ignavibacteria bacterium]
MQKGDLVELEIKSLNSEGDGIAKTSEGIVIFIKNAIPGDKLKAKILRKKRNYYIARIEEILNPSEHRTKPVCKHFGICGGCKFQNLDYNYQIKYKYQIVSDAFRKIGNFPDLNISEPIRADDIYNYRNKMEFSFSEDKWLENFEKNQLNNSKEESLLENYKAKQKEKTIALGLHIPNFHSKIVDIEECFLQSETSYKIVNFIREFFKIKNKSVYSIETHSGYLRFLIIRQSYYTQDLMVNLITYNYDEELIFELKEKLLEKFNQITTIINSISTKKAQIAIGDKTEIIYGNGYIIEQLNNGIRNLNFRISPNSFFQTNTKQCEKLFKEGMKLLDLKHNDSILDLYCGTGTISIFVADKVQKVLGVELSSEAIQDAQINTKLNNLSNLEFIKSDIKEYLKENKDLVNKFDKLILDPPRSGLHPDISKILSETNFSKILYISCNPSTQARDLKIICSKGKYKIEKLQPVDMFPNTAHIENICLLNSIN